LCPKEQNDRFASEAKACRKSCQESFGQDRNVIAGIQHWASVSWSVEDALDPRAVVQRLLRGSEIANNGKLRISFVMFPFHYFVVTSFAALLSDGIV
jgi:hypothetical protein